MRSLIAVLLACCAALSAAQVRLVDPKHRTELEFSREITKDGVIETQVWKVNGAYSRTLKITYSPSGQITKQVLSTRDTVRTAAISDGAASVTSSMKTTTTLRSNIPLKGQGDTRDPLAIWLAGGFPKAGTFSKFMNFSVEGPYWEEVNVLYGGHGSVRGSPEGNLVTREGARTTIQLVLDDKGLPIAWMERSLMLLRVKS